jgi:hypothetical protein
MTKNRMAPQTQAFHAARLVIARMAASSCGGTTVLCGTAPPPKDMTHGEMKNQTESATRNQSSQRFSLAMRVALRMGSVAMSRSPF